MKHNDDVFALLQDAAARASKYLRTIDDRPVAAPPSTIETLTRLGGPTPENSEDPFDVLSLLDTVGSPSTIATAGGRYFGYVVGGALPATVAASWLAAAWDQNTGLFDLSPVGVSLEQIAIRWLTDILYLPDECAAAFVSGAQMANFTALAAARYGVLDSAGWNVTDRGLSGAPPVSVVVSEESHITVLKALSLLGFGRKQLLRIPTDSQGRMRADRLPRIEGPAILCAQVGNVNTGSCDPVADICSAAKQHGVWVHVDGAFGLWAAAAPERRQLVKGVENADSWAVDAHKWLNVPYDSGISFVRSGEYLRAAMAVTADYLHVSGGREPAHYGPEFSRRSRGVEIWMALRCLGRAGIVDLIERTCRHAARFAERLEMAGYEILNDVVLNQVLVSFGPDEVTRRVVREVQADGTCWCGATVWHSRTAMRISVCSWATTEEDVDRSIEAIVRIGLRVKQAAGQAE